MEDLEERIIYVLPDILCGVVFIIIALPLVFRKIPMNNIYGFRFSKAFESDELWYRINAFGGKQLLLWSTVLVATGIVKWHIMDELDPFWQFALWQGPLFICLVIVLITTFIYEALQ
ncbi:MAG TPA: SdpI family protein [Candidatus Bathyarchaeia archaeon]|nr:SdpI family protein [Candidatus Bathyarchaeia archaeon]